MTREDRAAIAFDVLRRTFPKVRQGTGARAHVVVVWDAATEQDRRDIRNAIRPFGITPYAIQTPGRFTLVTMEHPES